MEATWSFLVTEAAMAQRFARARPSTGTRALASQL